MGEVVHIPAKKERNMHIKNTSDVKRLINQTINDLRNGELDGKKANAIGYLANILLKVFENEAIIDKVTKMETEKHGDRDIVLA